MESAGSAIVDFGRFCTGFLVVMGVGMCCAFPALSIIERRPVLVATLGGRVAWL